MELIYGYPFNPKELDNEFWYTFEMSLDMMDAEGINLFFGKSHGDLCAMEKSIRNASSILRVAFCRWIATIAIDNNEMDKHKQYNMTLLCMFLAMHGLVAEKIKNVYVLGHSMSLPDIDYFSFLTNATRIHKERTQVTQNKFSKLFKKVMEKMTLNLPKH